MCVLLEVRLLKTIFTSEQTFKLFKTVSACILIVFLDQLHILLNVLIFLNHTPVQKHEIHQYLVCPKDHYLQKVFDAHEYYNNPHHIYLCSLLFVDLVCYLDVLLLIFYQLLQAHGMLQTKLFLLPQNYLQRTARVNNILVFFLLFL